jgi:2-dehydropantoate 2-reductase
MRVCIFGAGAVGSHVAARLLRVQAAEISVVARGAHLRAMQDGGLRFRGPPDDFEVAVPVATDDPGELPPQDLVLVGLKANALTANAAAIARLTRPDGAVAFFNNGIPWWWRHGLPLGGGTLPLLDPDGALWRDIGPERAIGVVVYSPNELSEPGTVTHIGRSRFVLGRPDGKVDGRVAELADLLRLGGMGADVAPDIRREIWLKLMHNVHGNPLAALTRLTAAGRAEVPGLLDVGASLVREMLAVAAAQGWDLRAEHDPADVVRPSGMFANGRPSMLQDVLAGRPTEVETLLGQVAVFGREAGVATPVLDVVLPIMRGLDRSIR